MATSFVTKTIRSLALLLFAASAGAVNIVVPIEGSGLGLAADGSLVVNPRGGYPQVIVGGANSHASPVELSAAQIASPSAAVLAATKSTFQLNVAPYTRYRSTGTELVELGVGGVGSVAAGDITDASATAVSFLIADAATDMRGILGAQEAGALLDDFVSLEGAVAQGDIFYYNGTDLVRLAAGTSGHFLKTQGAAANPVWEAIPGGGDALTTNTLAQFATTTSAQVASVVSNETGSGALVFGTSPTITTPSLSGVVTRDGAEVLTANALAAFEIDTTKLYNTKTISAPQTFTFSAAPTSGSMFTLFIVNSDTSPHLITIPSSYSIQTQATTTTFVMPASSAHWLQWRYNGTAYRLWGEPRAADNYTATAAPTVNDDVSLGYAAGSEWLDGTNKVFYDLLDATDGAAVWRPRSRGDEVRIVIAISDETTDMTTGTAKVTFRMPFAMTLTAVRGGLSTASSSGVPTWDLNEAGTTVLSTKLTIDANEKTSTTAATAAVISDTALADDAEMTIDVDVSGTGARGGKITLIGYRL